MSTVGIYLEDSNGSCIQAPSDAQIRATLEQLGGALEHCILHLPGGAFVQTAGEPGRLVLEYADAEGRYESDHADLDVSTVASIFAAASIGDQGWKREHAFTRTGDGPVGGSGPQAAGVEDAAPAEQLHHEQNPERERGSVKDDLLGGLKREISREASRGMRNLVRKGMRSFRKPR